MRLSIRKFLFFTVLALWTLPAFAQQKLFWSTSEPDHTIYKSDLDGSNTVKLYNAGAFSEAVKDVEVDDVAEKLYWIDPSNFAIKRSNLDGSSVEEYFASPGGMLNIEIDPVARKIYWTAASDGSINRMNLDKTGPESSTGISSSSFAVAPVLTFPAIFFKSSANGIFYLFSSDFGGTASGLSSDNQTIAMKFMNISQKLIWYSTLGSALRKKGITDADDLSVTNLANGESPEALALDRTESTLYWADAGNSIMKLNLSGPASPVLVTTTAQLPTGITISCGFFAPDSDGDGTLNCEESCPNDPAKLAPGICGCGKTDTDTDGDGSADCNDLCPADKSKIVPGVCGCGTTESTLDSDYDGTPDCIDTCPLDPKKIAEGICGCGFTEVKLGELCTDDSIVDPKTEISLPPEVEVIDHTIHLILQFFKKASLKKKKIKPTSFPALLAATKDKITFRYSVTVQNTAKKNDVRKITSKKNELTIKNLKPGNYNVSYRAEIFENGEPAGKTNLSPKANFTIQ
jgi:hypothetical protein